MKRLLFICLILSALLAVPTFAADTKGSDLTELDAAPAESDVLYLIDGGVSKKITVLNLMKSLESALTGLAIDADNLPDLSGTYLTAESDSIVGAVTGIVKADGAGAISAASAGTDYQAPLSAGTDYLAPDGDGSGLSGVVTSEVDPVVGAITGIVKADGAGNVSAASAGTDYQAPLSAGTGLFGT